ncbi:MAG: hypothetical protein Q9191_000741 [Dirinaria sp. TL-2023a]
MDPMSIFGLASNVLQFVDFSFKLLNSTQKLYMPASGVSGQCQHLGSVHVKLLEFSTELADYETSSGTVRTAFNCPSKSRNETHFREVAKACQQDCERLLVIVEKLKVGSGKKRRWWLSFSKAILEVWASKDLEELKAQINNHRNDMTLRLCAMSCENVNLSITELQKLKIETNSANEERLQQFHVLRDSLEDLHREIQHIKAQVIDNERYGVRRGLEQEELDLLTAKTASLSLSEQNFEKEEAVLSSLNFPQRIRRYEAIPEAHQKSFRWIFDGPEQSKYSSEPRFREWLGVSGKPFWISGRPGSGKSTLMKFLANAPETMSSLSSWASPKRLIFASHYFWSAGSPIQRSREGLLRSLLYSFLSQAPEMIASICGKLWEKDAPGLHHYSWSFTDLETSLYRIAKLNQISVKFCFFVDGLDEFEGDSSTLSQLLLDLSRNADIKLCVSSRPWNTFEDSFGRNPIYKLYVHELTLDDIQMYAKSRLLEHPRWSDIATEAGLVEDLVFEITRRAQGVFLWVFLVTQLLREGLTNYDSIADLWKRLESVPVDLELFFRHILSSIEPFYHEKMAGTLLIALKAERPLPIEFYSYHDLEYSDENYVFQHDPRPLRDQEIKNLHHSTARRLNGWCKGLIEARDGEVEFLHRTVKDFLQTRDMMDFLKDRSRRGFHPSLSLCRASIAWTKGRRFFKEDLWSKHARWNAEHYTFSGSIHEIFEFAASLPGEAEYQDPLEILLDDLESSAQKMFKSGQLQVIASHSTRTSAQDVRTFYRQFVIHHDLSDYLSRKIACDAEYLADSDQPPLSMVLHDWVDGAFEERYLGQYPNTLECLLTHDESLNELIADELSGATTTPWTDFINHLIGQLMKAPNGYIFANILNSGLISLLLRYNADPNACIEGLSSKVYYSRIPFWVGWLLLIFHVPNLWRCQDQYLRDLGQLFEVGANIKLINSHVDTEIASKVTSLWMLFCSELDKFATKIAGLGNLDGTNDKQLDFVAHVLIKFAEAAKNDVVDWNATVPSLRRLFPQGQLRRVLEAMSISVQAETTHMRKRFRRPTPDAGDSSAAKRRRESVGGDERTERQLLVSD